MATEIRFYHMTRGSLETVLPTMLDRTVDRDGRRAVVIAGSSERVEVLNSHLWTYNERSFLAHGSREDGYAEDQPIWLTDRDENPNGAVVAFLADGVQIAEPGRFDLVCYLFDGTDPNAVDGARARWRHYKDAGHDLVYYQQDDRGAWHRREQD
jgi:DNA polymerase-3 subunit chi